MITLDNNLQAFLSLVKAGLFPVHVEGGGIHDSLPEDVDWVKVHQLAQEQSILGLVLAGLDSSSVKPPQGLLLQWIGEVQVQEQRNKAMNGFVAELIDRIRKEDIYAILVKGQGVAQCYEKPLWRSCGDVDLLLSDQSYRKAEKLLSSIASSVEEENTYNQHIAMTIGDWEVELHGTLRSGLWRKLDQELDRVQDDVLCGGHVRYWMNGQIQVFLPRADEDAVFVFSHILQHFYKEGIGLRQICDWCRLLYTYREKLDLRLLEQRIKRMGVMTEWKAFGALAVEYLGMPVEAMPMFGSRVQEFKGKAGRIMEFVLETGNFGHNRDYSYRQKYPYVVYKAISLWKHLQDFGRYFVIFPKDSIKVTWRRMIVGFSVAIRVGKHE